MKTKKAVAFGTILLMAMPMFSGMAIASTAKSHKVTLKNLNVDTATEATKTIVAHDASSVSYTIVFGKKSNIRRGTGDKASFSEIIKGDSITVWGKSLNGINISATKVRDDSIRKIRGLYKGTIIEIAPAGLAFPFGASGGFAMLVKNTTVNITWTFGNTKFKNGKHKISYADLQDGDVVSVKGILHLDTPFTPFVYTYNTTQVVVRSHGPVPSFSPTTFKKF